MLCSQRSLDEGTNPEQYYIFDLGLDVTFKINYSGRLQQSPATRGSASNTAGPQQPIETSPFSMDSFRGKL